MRSFLRWVLLVAGIFLASAFLTPFLYSVMPFFKFEKIFNRLVMIFSLAAAILFVRSRGNVFEKYGLNRKEGPWFVAISFFCGFFILAALLGTRLAFGTAVWQPQAGGPGLWASEFFVNLTAAFLIGLIEEFFFRGFLFYGLKDQLAWNEKAAMAVTSFFYAMVHFLSAKKPYIDATPTVLDSFRLMAAPLASWGDWAAIWPGVLGLFIFGIILNHAVIRTGSLYPAIGLHAGCVFFLKSQSLFVDVLNNASMLWGGSKMYDGAVGWGFLILLGILLQRFLSFSKLKVKNA